MSDEQILADAHAAEAVQTAAVHAEAVEKSRQTQMTASISEALRSVFSDKQDQGLLIDVSQVPLICLKIKQLADAGIKTADLIEKINEKLDDKFVTKEAFAPVQRIVYGAVALILITVLGGILALVIIHK